MLRRALALQSAGLAAAPWVEVQETRQNAFDRLLLGAAGGLTVAASILPRYQLARFARAVMKREADLLALDDATLRQRAAVLARHLRTDGLLTRHVVESFALIREASGRRLGKRHFAVQLMGGRVMLAGAMAEMRTGEGKTLTALLPAVTMALAGVPVHVVTVNEYLAARDAATLEPVYAFFGLTVGRVLPEQQPPERALAYRCDLTYCVNKDLTFDYLRDRIEVMAGRLGARAAVSGLPGHKSAAQATMRGLWFAVVDEADSIFIDEARTPLIITKGVAGEEQAMRCDIALSFARGLVLGQDALLRVRERHVVLTESARVTVAAICNDLLPAARVERERLIELALTALHCYERDRHYIVADGKAQIVDEYTGRVMPDRSWEGGLQQLIERKEGIATSEARETTARITYQRMFRRYLRVGGMSGTITEVAPEMKSVLGVSVVRIPTNRPSRLRSLGTRLFAASDARDAAVLAAAVREAGKGRAVLIGTRSVAASERIATLCAQAGLAHATLNAKQDADEAAVIGEAGHAGRVTVATNMAGRGTDIELEPAVREAGGLHVILTEFHDSTRIDRQLFGRAGRQGDPGSFECLVCLGDELFLSHAPRLTAWLARRHAGAHELPRAGALLLRRYSQRAAEAHHAEVRRHTLEQERDTDRSLAFAGPPE